MPSKDLGVKYTCFRCGTKFYDLKKPEPVCPKCSADQRESPVIKTPERTERRRSRSSGDESLIDEELLDEEVAEEESIEDLPEEPADEDEDF